MLRKSNGFSLVEMLVVMAIFSIVIALAGSAFKSLLGQSNLQTKSAVSQIGGIIGLELQRRDLELAGLGLPTAISRSISYTEAVSFPAKAFNDGNGAPGVVPPRAVVSGDYDKATNKLVNSSGVSVDAGTIQSDYLVVKATVLGSDTTAQKWTYIHYSSATKAAPHVWDSNNLGTPAAEMVTVVKQYYESGKYIKELVVTPAGVYAGEFSSTDVPAALATGVTALPSDLYFIYGLARPGSAVKMPFNRADYFVDKAADSKNIPLRCAPNTGILYKELFNQDGTSTKFALLDCVGDMQVLYSLDMNEDGTPGTFANANGSTVAGPELATAASVQATLNDAQLLSSRLKEIRLFFLTHEGGQDRLYDFTRDSILVSDVLYGALGRTWNIADMSARFGSNWRNYRWKVYAMSVKPRNLGNQN